MIETIALGGKRINGPPLYCCTYSATLVEVGRAEIGSWANVHDVPLPATISLSEKFGVDGVDSSAAAHQFTESNATSAQDPDRMARVAAPLIVPVAGVSVAVPAPWLSIKQDHGGVCVVKETATGEASENTISAPSSPETVAYEVTPL
jgi:hypothetical protein